MLETGHNPRMGIEPWQPLSHVESVNEFTDYMTHTLEEAKAALGKAKEDMAHYYNWCRTPTPQYQVGDKVYVDSSDIKTTHPSVKSSHRNLGPFTIQAKVGPNAYRLHLPATLR
jgi:hypothetical protein